MSEILFRGTGRLVPEKLSQVFELFRRKYGNGQVERWYGGDRARRRPVEVEVQRVLGKRPINKPDSIRITI